MGFVSKAISRDDQLTARQQRKDRDAAKKLEKNAKEMEEEEEEEEGSKPPSKKRKPKAKAKASGKKKAAKKQKCDLDDDEEPGEEPNEGCDDFEVEEDEEVLAAGKTKKASKPKANAKSKAKASPKPKGRPSKVAAKPPATKAKKRNSKETAEEADEPVETDLASSSRDMPDSPLPAPTCRIRKKKSCPKLESPAMRTKKVLQRAAAARKAPNKKPVTSDVCLNLRGVVGKWFLPFVGGLRLIHHERIGFVTECKLS